MDEKRKLRKQSAFPLNFHRTKNENPTDFGLCCFAGSQIKIHLSPFGSLFVFQFPATESKIKWSKRT